MVVRIASPDAQQTQIVACAICSESVYFGGVSLGAIYIDGDQAFACARHLAEHAKRSRWIVSWVDFTATQVIDYREVRP